MTGLDTAFTRHAGVAVPLICGAMYPCSNPELIAAVSDAGGLGIIQPMAMRFVHGRELGRGIDEIRALTDAPIGFNAVVEKTAKIYHDRMQAWVDVALGRGVRFFITALGNPAWVVERVHAAGGVVYHDVTERRWADKALAAAVDGLVCVNRGAGGHAGGKTAAELMAELGDLGVPLICAGGIGAAGDFVEALGLGYAGAQLGTRFIASRECTAHADYKRAIVHAHPDDIVLTEKISGVPVSVIRTPYVERVGTRAGPIARRLLRHRRGKRLMRGLYALKSMWQLGRASMRGASYRDYFQAGKSVGGIDAVEPAGDIVRRFAAARAHDSGCAGA